jgi:hypothetical protein
MGDTTLPDWHRRDNFHVEPHQAVINQVNRLLNLSVSNGSDVYDLGNGRGIVPHGVAQVRLLRAFKVIGDVALGGTYKILFGSSAPFNLNPSPTSVPTLDLSLAGVDFSNTNKVGTLINEAENGSQVWLLPTNGTCIGWGPVLFSGTSEPFAPIIIREVTPPPVLLCSSVGSGTNAFIYDLRRMGDPTGPLVAHNVSPWRTFSTSPTNYVGLLIAATETHWMQSGTGISMTDCNEKWNLNLCGTTTPYY